MMPTVSDQSKNIDIKYQLIVNSVHKVKVKLHYVPTSEMVAHMVTINFNNVKFLESMKLLKMEYCAWSRESFMRSTNTWKLESGSFDESKNLFIFLSFQLDSIG